MFVCGINLLTVCSGGKKKQLLVLCKDFISTGYERLLAFTLLVLHQRRRAEMCQIAVFSSCCVKEA